MSDTQAIKVYMSQKAQEVIGARARYKVLEGGRGSGKSYSFADALIARAAHEKVRALCTRETQNSIRDSVHRLLQDRICFLGYEKFYVIQKDGIFSRCGSEFIFKGLHHNISEIKSTEGIDICWVEEAERVSGDSWTILIPTVRKEDSEIWVSFNPEDEESATYTRFIKNPPPDCRSAHLTFRDNEMFPEVLRREMEYDKRVDKDKYEHVWEGKCKGYSDALIFKNVVVEEFETPDNIQLYFGADFGFSNDPAVLGRMFIQDKKLFIDYEAYGVGVEIDDLETFYMSVPDSKVWEIRADSERPDTISYLSQRGFNITGAEKGKGSVADGIAFLRSFEKIIIHPRCRGAIDNFKNYKWKKDRITGKILPIPADGSDHWPDAARYALEPYIKNTDVFAWSA